MISSKNIAKASALLVKNGNKTPEQVSESVLKFVKKYNLESQLPQILTHLKAESEKEKLSRTLFVHTPHEIDKDTMNTIADYVSVPDGTLVKIKMDKELIGGFKVYWRDLKIDGSIQNTLKRLKDSLLTS